MYVIYSENETRANEDLGPAFWSSDGWTDFHHADVFKRKLSWRSIPRGSAIITRDLAIHLYRLYKLTKDAEVE